MSRDYTVQKANEKSFFGKNMTQKTYFSNFNKSLRRISTQDLWFTRPMPQNTEL